MIYKHRGEIISCFECIAIAHCYGSTHPHLSRENARLRASSCRSLRKGFSTERITVLGSNRGMSRKKAEKMVNCGLARWIKPGTIQMIGRPEQQ